MISFVRFTLLVFVFICLALAGVDARDAAERATSLVHGGRILREDVKTGAETDGAKDGVKQGLSGAALVSFWLQDTSGYPRD
eukprot:gene17616-23949_t